MFRIRHGLYRCDMPNRVLRCDSRYQPRIIPSSPLSSLQEKAFQPNSFHPSSINSFLTTSPHFSLPSRGVSNISLNPNPSPFTCTSGNSFIFGGSRPYYVNNSFPSTQRRKRRRRRGKGKNKYNKNSQVINTFSQRGSFSVYHSKQYTTKYFINWTRDVNYEPYYIRAQR